MKPVCRRCLLFEADAGGVYETIRRRIAQLPDDARAADSEYQRRLDRCRTCDALVNGLCTICGCFTELRAAKSAMHCPHPSQYW